MSDLTLTLVQADLLWESPEENRKKLEALILDADKTGDLILLPEMFTTGFTMNAKLYAEPPQGTTTKWMQKIAIQKQAVVVGSIIVNDNGSFFNRLVAVGPDGILAEYDKRHLFRMATEHEHYSPGQNKTIFQWKGWKICPLVCYDLRFPVWSRNHIDAKGTAEYDLLLYVANWPVRRVHHWKTLLNARAIENQCYVAGLNRFGTDGAGFSYTGDSQIVDFSGAILASSTNIESVFSWTINKEKLEEYRRAFPAWMDADEFMIR